MGYTYYRKLTVDHTKCGSADSTNFPVLFSGTYSWLATVAHGGRVQSASGYDIVFAGDALGLTPYNFERVTWNATTGACEFWIQVPTLSHSADTPIYVLYGNSSISTDQQNRNGTWDSSFKAVYHFGDGSSLDLTDSTSNANNGTNHGSATAASDLLGGTGGAVHLAKASSQYIDCGNDSSIEITGSVTVEAWLNADSLSTSPTDFVPIVDTTAGGNGYQSRLHANTGTNANALQGFVRASATTKEVPSAGNSAAAIATSTTYHFVWTYDGTTAHDYKNGGADPSSGNPATWGASAIGASTSSLKLGFDTGNYWDGALDEVRISNTNRSASYVLATYNSGSSPSTFYSVGAETLTSVPTQGLSHAAGTVSAVVISASPVGLSRAAGYAPLSVISASAIGQSNAAGYALPNPPNVLAQGLTACAGHIAAVVLTVTAQGRAYAVGYAIGVPGFAIAVGTCQAAGHAVAAINVAAQGRSVAAGYITATPSLAGNAQGRSYAAGHVGSVVITVTAKGRSYATGYASAGLNAAAEPCLEGPIVPKPWLAAIAQNNSY